MKKIKLTDEQKKQHPFATEIVNLFNTYTADDLLEELDNYIFETMSYAADLLNKEVLLGYLPLYGPDE